jgi:hypothetical protein
MGTVENLHPDLVERRARTFATLDPYLIQVMERPELCALQEALGYGSEWGKWIVPEAWVPRTIRSYKVIRISDSDTPQGDRAWTEILRFLLLRSLVKGSQRLAKPTTVVMEAKVAIRMIPKLRAASGPKEAWWSRWTQQEYEAFDHVSGKYLCQFLQSMFRRGLLPEQPTPRPQDNRCTEVDRHGRPAPGQHPDASKTYQPLPDAFTGQCGQRVLWLIKMLGPAILDCFETCIDLKLPPTAAFSRSQLVPSERTKQSVKILTNEERNRHVRRWAWRTSDGKPVDKLPFSLHWRTKIPGATLNFENFSWPPRTWGDLFKLVRLLQSAHAWLLFLTSGPRISTVLSYTISCLSPSPVGYRTKGALFKTSDQLGGRQRDWPAPPVLVETINQQVRLATLIKRLANPDDPESMGDHLWVQVAYTQNALGAPLNDWNFLLNRMVDVFSLRHLLGDDNPTVHTHRFRKTLARIVALSLTNSQMILMDCFGHDDPDMTLGYILSDKAILADVQRVQRELVILMATDAIENAEDLGGTMGVEVRHAKQYFMRIKNTPKLSPKDVYELADQLTLGGREWVYIMQGVICTLPHLSTGPCAQKQGGRNPMYCQSGCQHQLLLAYNKTNTDDAVADILSNLQRAIDEGAEMLISMFAAQLRNWLYRWREVFEKWVDHPLVRIYGDPNMTREAIAS